MSVRLDHGEDELAEVHEINVTPFIDVILVLLIIFMIAAPLATVDTPVDLPTSSAQPAPRPDKPVFVTIKANGSLLLGEMELERSRIGAGLDEATGGQHDQRIYVRADRAVPYGDLTDVLNELRAAGYTKIALVALEGPPSP